jgi:hypothetical protein
MTPRAPRAARACVSVDRAYDRAGSVGRELDGKVVTARRLSRQAAHAVLDRPAGNSYFFRDPSGLLLEEARKLAARGHRGEVVRVATPEHGPQDVTMVLGYIRARTAAGEPVCGTEKLAKAVRVRPQTARSVVAQLKRDNLIVDEPVRNKRGPLKPRLWACTAADFVRPAPRAQPEAAAKVHAEADDRPHETGDAKARAKP